MSTTLHLADLLQLAGTAAMIGTLAFGLYRWVDGKLTDLRKTTSASVSELHTRIDRVRDEYVRRVDLGDHIKSIEQSQDTLNRGIERIHSRIDEILLRLGDNQG